MSTAMSSVVARSNAGEARAGGGTASSGAGKAPAGAGRARLTPSVHKFGGAALANSSAICRTATLVELHVPAPCVIVVSAMAGVTDAFLALTAVSQRGSRGIVRPMAELRARHEAALTDVSCDSERRTALREVDQQFEDLVRIVLSARRNPGMSPHDQARILSLGEKLSARIVVAHLRSRGIDAEFIDATEVIATTAGPLDAAPDVERTRELARRAILRRVARGVMPVVPGFIGSSTNGSTTTLGRGGSDLTATLLAAALGSREVQLWKDVPGLLSADPRVVPDARLLKRISVDEAAALSRHGSRLIHPKALAVLDRATRVRVRSFGNPLHDGTVIAAGRPNTGQPVKAITSLQGLSMITVGHTGLQESVWAVAYRAVSSSGNGLWFVPLSAGAADASACMLVRGADAACVVSRVRRAVNAQSRKEAPNAPAVEVRSGLAAIGIVGPGVGGSGTASAMALRALEDAAVEVYASGAGHGQNSMTLVVDGAKAAVAQRALHGAFQLHLSGGGRLAQANYRAVLLVGTGTIGRALLAQLASVGDRLRICGVVDTSGYLCSAEGLTRKQAAAVLSAKSSGGCLRNLPDARAGGAADALRELSNHALSRKVLIDATAAETGHLLREAAAGGWDLVLANKLPLAGGQQAADELRAVVRGNRRAFRFEATVGAGLPVIQTVRKLQHSGDTVRRIEGCPSGTLGFVFGELERGSSFSAAVRLASERGLTEPDPRVDLSGLDVARKALILGRLLGFRGELQDVAVESLVPERLLTASITDFLHSLRQEDAAWAARVRRARARGRVLRYRIRVTHRKVAAGLAEVDASDSLGRLSGTDNQFTFTSARYGSNPLVITGPGAGAEVTAAGVLGDLLELDSMETWP